jgi:IMP dehydrogenase
MAYYFSDVSRTFSEYLLIPGLTRKDCVPDNVSFKNAAAQVQKRGKTGH